MESHTTELRQYDVNAIPRFANMATFMRAPHRTDPTGLDVAMMGVPFDLGSSFRIGARHGPSQIREMSRHIRQVNYASGIAPFELCRIADMGDTPMNSLDMMASLDSIQEFFCTIIDAGATPLAAGGDHTISLPILRAIARHRPVGLLLIDAHSDTLDTTLGKKISNGTPFRRAVEEELLEPQRIVQVGIRGTLFRADDLEWAKSHGITIIDIDDFYDMGVRAVIARVREIVGSGPCYLSFDVDGLDPVYAPGTGSLEPGGLTVRDAQLLLRGMRGLDLVGADVTEVCPPLDPSGNTALVAANIMFEQLCLLAETRTRIREASTG